MSFDSETEHLKHPFGILIVKTPYVTRYVGGDGYDFLRIVRLETIQLFREFGIIAERTPEGFDILFEYMKYKYATTKKHFKNFLRKRKPDSECLQCDLDECTCSKRLCSIASQ